MLEFPKLALKDMEFVAVNLSFLIFVCIVIN